MKTNLRYFIILAFFFSAFGQKTLADIPIIQADTVFKGFPTGQVGGIVIANEGKSFFLIHGSQPVEIDMKTHQILRTFEGVPNKIGTGDSPIIIKSKNYITVSELSSDLYGVKNFNGNVVWDLETGKIIKAINNVYLLTDGEKYYTKNYTDNYTKAYLGRYDINSFKMADSIYLPSNLPGNGYVEWRGLGIIPNSNKVLLGANRYNEFTQGEKEYLLSELYLFDFDTKKFTKITIPYETDQKSSEIYQIKVSEKYIIIGINVWDSGRIFFFYDNNFNFLYKLQNIDFVNMTDIESVSTSTILASIMDDYLLFYLSNDKLSRDRMAFYNIQQKRVTKYLEFLGGGVYDPVSRKIALMGDLAGLVGVYDLDALPVQDSSLSPNLQITYTHNQLEFYSDRAFAGDAQIYDISGKLIANLVAQPFALAKNIIPVNQTLPPGVYILSIINGTEHISGKFMVE